jgi:hypothetical protein
VFLIGFPLLLIPFAIYNIVVFVMAGDFAARLFTLHLQSGIDYAVSFGDVLIGFAILLLFVEFLKLTRHGGRSAVDHLLSFILLVVVLAEFMLVPQAATQAFLVLLALSFIDVVGGFSLMPRKVQRAITLEGVRRVESQV